MRSGTTLQIRIGEATQDAVASDGTFAVAPGQIAFAPGSSGWTMPDGSAVVWMELFLRGGSAAETFGQPAIGAEIEITEENR